MLFILFYDYVEDVLERRAPFREGHLGQIKEFMANDEILMAGAFADPVDGAAIIFDVEDQSRIEVFVNNDPYIDAGLVTQWRIRPWTVVPKA